MTFPFPRFSHHHPSPRNPLQCELVSFVWIHNEIATLVHEHKIIGCKIHREPQLLRYAFHGDLLEEADMRLILHVTPEGKGLQRWNGTIHKGGCDKQDSLFGQEIGQIRLRGKNDVAGDLSYATLRTIATDVTDGTENGRLDFLTHCYLFWPVAALTINSGKKLPRQVRNKQTDDLHDALGDSTDNDSII